MKFPHFLVREVLHTAIFEKPATIATLAISGAVSMQTLVCNDANALLNRCMRALVSTQAHVCS